MRFWAGVRPQASSDSRAEEGLWSDVLRAAERRSLVTWRRLVRQLGGDARGRRSFFFAFLFILFFSARKGGVGWFRARCEGNLKGWDLCIGNREQLQDTRGICRKDGWDGWDGRDGRDGRMCGVWVPCGMVWELRIITSGQRKTSGPDPLRIYARLCASK